MGAPNAHGTTKTRTHKISRLTLVKNLSIRTACHLGNNKNAIAFVILLFYGSQSVLGNTSHSIAKTSRATSVRIPQPWIPWDGNPWGTLANQGIPWEGSPRDPWRSRAGSCQIGNCGPAPFGNYNRGSETTRRGSKTTRPPGSETTITRFGNYAHAVLKLRPRFGNYAPAWIGNYDRATRKLTFAIPNI